MKEKEELVSRDMETPAENNSEENLITGLSITVHLQAFSERFAEIRTRNLLA